MGIVAKRPKLNVQSGISTHWCIRIPESLHVRLDIDGRQNLGSPAVWKQQRQGKNCDKAG
jgi:hypothetical protein